jgi:hypothetical protein
VALTDASLLERLQGVIERTYDLQTGVRDIGRYVIGDEGYRRIYGGLAAAGRLVEKVGTAVEAGAGARTMLRESGQGGLAVLVYYPDSLIECLERNDPTRRLDDANIDAFSVLVEELDHFLVIADRYRRGGEASLLELELHANVTKHLVLGMFVGKMRRTSRLSQADRAWIRFHLFEKGIFSDPDPEVRSRYRDASRFAVRYVDRLDRLSPPNRVRELKRFHRMSSQAMVGHLSGDRVSDGGEFLD